MSNSLPTGKQGVPQHPHGSAKPKAEPVDITVKTSRGQQREAEILNAAREVFLEKGFERASVSEIAARLTRVVDHHGAERILNVHYTGTISLRVRRLMKPNRLASQVPRVKKNWVSCPPIDTMGTIGTPASMAVRM